MKRDTHVLPRYRSKEFFPTFKWREVGDSGMIEKFKRDGELTSETPVCIKKIFESDYQLFIESGHEHLFVFWERPTCKGNERIKLFKIRQTDDFLEFLDRLTVKKGTVSKYWEVPYGLLVAVCEFCEKDADGFRALLRKAQDSKELMGLFGVV